jgi:hypothetical protein
MKNILFLFALLGSTTLAVAQLDKTPYLTRSLDKETIKQVQASTSGGSIAVTGVPASEARLEVYIQASNGMISLSKDEIQKRLNEDYELTITVANNQLTATAKTKHNNMNWKRALSISFKIFTPTAVNTDLHTSGGSIHLDNLSGREVFRTSGGSLHIDQVTGSIDGKTSGGSIAVKNSSSDIELHTSGGSIQADNCSGTIKLNTSGGTITLNNLKGKIKANTSGGSIRAGDIDGDLSAHTSGGSVALNNLRGSLETSTSGGNIQADIKELGKFVTISNSGGNITLNLPDNKGLTLDLHANKIRTDGLKNFTGKADDDRIAGTMNGGGIPITINASSGNLAIKM